MFKLIPIIAVSLLFSLPSFASDSWSPVVDFQTRMAKSGNVKAQFILGEMYEQGRGVKKDLQQALKWYSKASKGGHKNAASRIPKVNYKIENPEPEPVVKKEVARLEPEPVSIDPKPAEKLITPDPEAAKKRAAAEKKKAARLAAEKKKKAAELAEAKRKARMLYEQMGSVSGYEDAGEKVVEKKNHLDSYVEAFE